MARTILVAAVTALAVTLGFQALAKRLSTPPHADDPAVSSDTEILRRLKGVEERLGQLSLRSDRAPPRLEGRPEIAVSRIEALEARMAELAKQTADARHGERVVQQAAKAGVKKSADVDRWIKALHDKSENVAFSATLELARLKDPRAVDPLIAVLRHYNDFYVRLGAAVALGDIEALDAVEYLIDALDDKDALVRTAASDALQKITGGRIAIAQDATPEERQQGQEAWRLFWKENEARLRDDA